MTSLMAEKMYSFAFFRLSRIGESAISMPVTIMLRGASIFPMSFTGVSMTDGSFIWQKKSRSPAIMAITLYWLLSFSIPYVAFRRAWCCSVSREISAVQT